MNNVIKNFYLLYNNPFVFAPLILKFYEKTNTSNKNILLSFLILPLVLYDSTKKKIKSTNARSNLFTFCKKNEIFFGLNDRIKRYKSLTTECLQYLIDTEKITIENDSVKIVNTSLNCVTNLQDSLKASEKLKNIFKNYDPIQIYRALGIKEL